MPKPKDPFGGKVTIVQTGSAEDAAQYAGPGRVIAFLPNAPKAVVDQAKAKGASVVIWQPDWASSADTAAKAKEVNADGVLVQTEGPSQEANLTQTQSALQGSDMPVWIVTNNYRPDYPPGIDGVMYESYPGTNSQNTVDSTASDVAHRGWTGPAYPMIGGDKLGPNNDAEVAAAAARGGYAIFPPNIGNTAETNGMIKTPRGGTQPSSTSTNPQPTSPPAATLRGEPPQKKTVPAAPAVPTGYANPASHFAAGTKGAPPIYDEPTTKATAIMDPAKTFSFTDHRNRKVTITTTSTGARIEQVQGEKAYQIGAPTIPQRAANWRANPNWSGAAGVDKNIVNAVSAKTGLSADNIIEQRPGAPGTGNTVVRVVDGQGNGKYYTVHPDGTVTAAGDWDSSHRGEIPGQHASAPAPTPGESAPPSGQNQDPTQPQQPQPSAATIAQNANAHPAEVEHLAIGPAGPMGPPVHVDAPPETNPVANFNPSVVGGLSEN